MAKEFLSQKGIPFIERDVSRDAVAHNELRMRTGQTGVPAIFVDGQMIIGFDRPRLEQLIVQAQAQRPTFGAAIADAARMTQGAQSGAYVGRVRPGSPAQGAGLMGGDVVTALNQQPVLNASDLESALARLAKGSRFSLTVVRGGTALSLEGTL
ncbi:MAG: PDZ domain-containing protein [Chloroflexi bacterium]|nr:PDZ domain-containing protein [Chloroflexota bacterium]